MEASTIILTIVLGFFAVLFILLIVYVVQVNKVKNVAKGASTRMPPLEYMRSIGIRCPDYWEDMGPDPTRKGYHICYNRLNIPVYNPSNSVCYTDSDKRTKSFIDCGINDEGKIDSADGEKERCNFVAQCGPSENMTASWLGISSEQMSPGYTSCGNVSAR